MGRANEPQSSQGTDARAVGRSGSSRTPSQPLVSPGSRWSHEAPVPRRLRLRAGRSVGFRAGSLTLRDPAYVPRALRRRAPARLDVVGLRGEPRERSVRLRLTSWVPL